jgi:hypothetical protein
MVHNLLINLQYTDESHFRTFLVPGVNDHHPPTQNGKAKKRNDAPIDPATIYATLKNRIAALEEEEILEEEEERRYGRSKIS